MSMSSPELEQECPIKNPSSILESFNEMVGFVQIPHPPISEHLYTGFLLPIEYLEKSQQTILAKNVADDLELIQLTDNNANDKDKSSPSQQKTMYELFAEPSNDFGNLLIPEMAKRYTTNIGFLEDTQKVVGRMVERESYKVNNTARFLEIWKEIKEDKSFLDRHSYMEFVVLEELNRSRTFLNTYSILNLISPIYGLLLPLIILILPFVLLKIWNVPITFEVYLSTLRDVSKTHFIGRILNVKEWNFENVLYIVFIGGMYIMQTYTQITSCIKYHAAIKRMNENLLFMREYLEYTIESMNAFTKTNSDLPYYSDFCQDVHSHKLVLLTLRDKIGTTLTPYGWTMKKITELGHMFDCYYQLYSCIDFEASLRYSVGFEGYIDIMRGVARGYKAGFLGKTTFCSSSHIGPIPERGTSVGIGIFSVETTQEFRSENEEKEDQNNTKPRTIFKSQYYPPHKRSNVCIKNTVNMAANMIITGVNASGKTTTLKTTALNIIFSQQFGFGFYESAELTPYKHIHSYLNIPDTSGRDSLFQAESRRCKEILDKIKDAPTDEHHFCIFDELYSGTNPKEAVKSAHSLLKYLSQKPNVRFILTTHYVNVCRKFRKSKLVKNYKMIVDVDVDEKNGFVYTYKMGKGISTLEGGIAILKTMNYPAEIINTIERNTDKNMIAILPFREA